MLVQYCTVIIILAKQVISLFTYKTPSYPPLDCNLFTNIIKYIAHRKHTETSHFLAQHRSCSFPQIFFIKVLFLYRRLFNYYFGTAGGGSAPPSWTRVRRRSSSSRRRRRRCPWWQHSTWRSILAVPRATHQQVWTFLVNYEILVRAGDVSHISCRS